MGANYNARPCADGRKAAGAGTMGINGKTMQRTMETMKNTMGRLRPVVASEDRQWGCARSLPDEPGSFVGLWKRPAAQFGNSTIGKGAQERNHVQTRECHSALNAMRPLRQEC